MTVPNEVINQYQEIAKLSGLELKGLEAEAFSLSRSAVKEKDSEKTISLIDIGAQSTTCSIIDKGILKLSRSFDIAGNELTQILAKSLDLDYQKAEELKKRYGLAFLEEDSEKEPQKIAKALIPAIDSILVETKRIFQKFKQTENKEIQKVILAGGSALITGVPEYFSSFLEKETEMVNPFADIFYPPALEEALKEMNAGYAIAVGAALRFLE